MTTNTNRNIAVPQAIANSNAGVMLVAKILGEQFNRTDFIISQGRDSAKDIILLADEIYQHDILVEVKEDFKCYQSDRVGDDRLAIEYENRLSGDSGIYTSKADYYAFIAHRQDKIQLIVIDKIDLLQIHLRYVGRNSFQRWCGDIVNGKRIAHCNLVPINEVIEKAIILRDIGDQLWI